MGEAASAPKAPPAVAPAAATPGQAADVWHPRAVIVHPRFVHTLGDLPVAAEPLPPTNWRCLPAELVEHIAGCLESERDVLNLAAVCRDARPLASNERLWCSLCRRRFGVPPEPAPPGEADFWLRLYRWNHRLFVGISRSSSGSGLSSMGGGPRFFAAGGPLMVINM